MILASSCQTCIPPPPPPSSNNCFPILLVFGRVILSCMYFWNYFSADGGFVYCYVFSGVNLKLCCLFCLRVVYGVLCAECIVTVGSSVRVWSVERHKWMVYPEERKRVRREKVKRERVRKGSKGWVQ